MRLVSIAAVAAAAMGLCGCAVVGPAASVAGSVISTAAEVTGDVIGAASRTVTGSGSKDSK